MHAGHADADGSMGRVRALPPAVRRGAGGCRARAVSFNCFSTQSNLKSLRAEDSRYQKSRYETGQSLGATALVLWTLLIQNVLMTHL